MKDQKKTKSQLIEELERLRRSGSASQGDAAAGEWAERILRIQRDLAIRLSGTSELRETLQTVLDGILQTTGLDSGGIYLFDNQTGDLDIAYHRGLSGAFVEEIAHYGAGSQNVNLVNAGEPVYIEYEKLDVPKTEAEREEGLKVIAVVPLKAEGEVIGCVNAASHQLDEIPERSREAIEILAGVAGQAVSRSRLATEVRDSEERYRVLHDYAGYAVYTFDRDFVLTDINKRACEMLGYEKDELLGKIVMELGVVHPDDLEKAASNMERLFDKKEAVRDEIRFIHKGGETVIADSIGVPLLDEKGEVAAVVNISQDVTERRRTEEALYLEREQLLSIFDGINEAIYVADPETYEVLFANRHLKDAFGKELVGGICYREFQGFDEPCDFCTNDIILNNKDEPYRWEYHNPVLDRYYAITDRKIKWPDGRDVRFELAVDITEQKKAEEEIRKSEEKYRTLYSSMKEGLCLHDIIYNEAGKAVDYVITDVNLAYESILGIKRQDAIGTRASELYSSDKPPYVDIYAEVAATGQPTYFETYFPPMDKHFSISVFSPTKGKFATVFSDITERKLVDEELKEYREHLEELVEERTSRLEEKNAELEAFAYSISHDLRAPLRAMQGFSRALQEDYAEQLDEKGRDYAERVVSAAERMDSLIGDLLEYSRITRSELRLGTVDLDEVIEDTLQQLEAGIRDKGALVTVEGPLQQVKAHYATILQVVANLVSNAVMFVAPGVKPEVRIGGEERNGWVRLWVADNGIGIAPEYRERIFRIFERLHGMETYPGTGIGLAVVSKGMERMGGRVGMESEEGKGSEFWIELPKGEES